MYSKPTTGEIREIVRSEDWEKMIQIPIEDLRTFFENEEQRELISMDGIKNLYAAICEQAVNDYKSAHKITLFKYNSLPNLKKSTIERQLENFFGEDFFLNVTGLSSKEQAVRTIEKTMIEEQKQKAQKAMVKST